MNLTLFDLDNTLLGGDSDHAWGQFLCDQGVVDRHEYETTNDRFYAQYKDGSLDMNAFLAFVLAPMARLPRAELDALHVRFMRECIEPIVLPRGLELVREHLDAGDLVAIVTATNAFVTAPIARLFGVQHLIATVPAQENGRFTGLARGTPAFREGKIARVEAWLESMALHWGSFAQTNFYSDSLNDLPLLQKVKRPVAVDPDETLRAYATERGWPVISLRQR
ncbi:HAD family hydrolase [Uliginosibacterium sp. sgz301328]|uniref:histidinol-phosphatase n=1 Tax=Uliginosibacterium sp. sgz301328 TaxID=3243764 RepID=UPI00359D398C